MVIIVNETQNDFFIVKESKANEDRLYLMTRLQKEEEKTGNKHLGYLNNNRVGEYWSVRTGSCEKLFAETGYLSVPKKMTTKMCIRSHNHTTFYKGNRISLVEGKPDEPEYGGQTRVVILTDKTVDDAYSQNQIARLDTDLKTTPLSEGVFKYVGPRDTYATVFTFKDRSFEKIGGTNTYIWISPNKKLKVGVVTIKANDESDDKITINALIRCHPTGSFMMDDKKSSLTKRQRNQNKKAPQKKSGKKPSSKNASPNNTNKGGKPANYTGKPRSNNRPFGKNAGAATSNNEKQYNKKSGGSSSRSTNKPKNTSKSLSKLERNKNKYN